MRFEISGSFFLRALTATTLFFATLSSSAAVQDRIAGPIQGGESAAVRGNVHPLARAEADQGPADASMMMYRMLLTFRPSAEQQSAVDALLAEQQNPLSPYYHQWLTPEQFADRFGMSASDIAKAVDWLKLQGFSVDEVARSRTYVAFSGTVAQVESAFRTAIHQFQANGRMHYANVADPQLPAALANVVVGIRGLNDFRLKPRVARRSPRPEFTSSSSGSHFIVPDDFATIYDLKALYNSGIDGSGQTLAVMGQTDLVLSDIATFRKLSGLPANVPVVKLVPGSADPGVVNGDIDEANLDVQWSGAVARNATIVYVNSKNGAFDSLGYAISQNLAAVLSISYGDCEPNFSSAEVSQLKSWGQQANAQGQTIVGPSGDSGAADCDYPPANSTTPLTSASHGLAVDVPASLPYITGVGGTTFNEGANSSAYWSSTNNTSNGSALSYIPEVAWNDTTFEIANGGSLAATGGGASNGSLAPFAFNTKPSWQVGAGVPNDGRRDVPDISLSASFDHDGLLICSQGSCVNGFRQANNNLLVIGGTSAGAPTFAGIVTLINQQIGAAQGNVNPRLYQLAGTSKDAFHDITSGDNKVPCTSGTTDCPSGTTTIGFSAGVGYDRVTGLGSVDANNLVNEWSTGPNFRVSLAATTMILTAGASGNVGNTTVNLIAQNGFTGSISLGCSVPASLPGTTCTVTPNSVANSGSATVTVTAPTTRTVDLHSPRLFPHFFPWTDGTFAIAMGLMLAGRSDRSHSKRNLALFALLMVMLLASMIGCGGGGSSLSSSSASSSSGTSAAGSGAVKVTATSGATTRNGSISVTVQ